METFDRRRVRMLERQLIARGISEARVQQAFLDVPRELFLAESLAEFAYEDSPLFAQDERGSHRVHRFATSLAGSNGAIGAVMWLGDSASVLPIKTPPAKYPPVSESGRMS